ncbi:DUF2863 family protein [Oxalobacter sp. OttesenSCG-928-P03]|nr:DUF2863 family protein [Oxalobacter sp. OttesenSCG-928-P03]
MPPPEKKDFLKLLPDSQRLVSLSVEISTAASRSESRFWAKELEKRVLKLLETKKQQKLDAAIEYLYDTDLDAYNLLLETIETLSESCVMEHEGADYNVLLVVAPILAWTRFTIPSGRLSAELFSGLSAALAECVFAENTRFVLAPELYAIDQLPQTHTEVFSLMKDLADSMHGKAGSVLFKSQETSPFLADVRYLVMAASAPASQPLFRWQTLHRTAGPGEIRAQCLENWQEKALPQLSNMMHGCVLDVMAPDAFFDTCRKADQQIRPASVHAAVNYLTQVLDISVTDLRAVIGAFTETAQQEFVTEYRIGFFLRDNPQILYGVVWPVYGAEEVQQTLRPILPGEGRFSAQAEKHGPLARILTLLKESGIKCEKNHTEWFPMEFCEECGAPLFADVSAELVHAELPESAGKEPRLH